jgi:hypothetical protein
MNVEIGTEAGQFFFWECINGIFVAAHRRFLITRLFFIANSAELKKKIQQLAVKNNIMKCVDFFKLLTSQVLMCDI